MNKSLLPSNILSAPLFSGIANANLDLKMLNLNTVKDLSQGRVVVTFITTGMANTRFHRDKTDKTC